MEDSKDVTYLGFICTDIHGRVTWVVREYAKSNPPKQTWDENVIPDMYFEGDHDYRDVSAIADISDLLIILERRQMDLLGFRQRLMAWQKFKEFDDVGNEHAKICEMNCGKCFLDDFCECAHCSLDCEYECLY
jgi:hypothetical protein